MTDNSLKSCKVLNGGNSSGLESYLYTSRTLKFYTEYVLLVCHSRTKLTGRLYQRDQKYRIFKLRLTQLKTV